jgi:hypothetical protein
MPMRRVSQSRSPCASRYGSLGVAGAAHTGEEESDHLIPQDAQGDDNPGGAIASRLAQVGQAVTKPSPSARSGGRRRPSRAR